MSFLMVVMFLTAEQRKYCTTRKELLAVLRFCRQFRYYLLGRKFLVRTDHYSLVRLLGFKNIEGQLSHWIQELSQFDMTVIHRPRKLHTNADALSRIPDSVEYCGNYTKMMLMFLICLVIHVLFALVPIINGQDF